MSIHRSLVPRNKLVRHRNVLSRAERITILSKEDKWKESDSVFGLPKVKHVVHKRIKVKKEKPVEAAAAVTTEAAAAAEAVKPGAAPSKDKAPKGKEEAKK